MTDSTVGPRRSVFDVGRPLGVALIILAVLTVCAAAYSVQKSRYTQQQQQIAIDYNRRVLDCQNAYAEANSVALAERTKASELDRVSAAEDRASAADADESILILFNSLTATQALPDNERRAIGAKRYQEFLDRAQDIKQRRAATDARRAEAEQRRRENPLPAARCPTPEPIPGPTPEGTQS